MKPTYFYASPYNVFISDAENQINENHKNQFVFFKRYEKYGIIFLKAYVLFFGIQIKKILSKKLLQLLHRFFNKKTKNNYINKTLEFQQIMKRLNFVEEVGKYTRGFTCIYVEENQLFIGHTINNKKTKIEIENLIEWIKYFDRI